MIERAGRDNGALIDLETVALAVGYLAVLVAIGAAIALALGRSLGPFLADLFSDPIWLFGTVFGVFLLVTWNRRRRE